MQIKRSVIAISSLIILLLVSILSSCSLPYMGKIVDSQSGHPIEGAVIVRSWNRISASPGGGVTSFVDLSEGLSSDNGRFYVQGVIHFPDIPLLSNTYETSVVYKPGYKFIDLKEKSWTIKLEKIPTLYSLRHEELNKTDQEHSIERWKSRVYNDIYQKEQEYVDVLKDHSKNWEFWLPFNSLESNKYTQLDKQKSSSQNQVNKGENIQSNLKILSDRNENISKRYNSMVILADSKDPLAFNVIVETLKEEQLQQGAVHQLAKFSDVRAEKYLINALENPNHEVRYAAAQGLANYKDVSALNALSKHVNDDDSLVRLMSKKSLGFYSSPDGQKEIASLINELADQSLRELASYKLGIIIGQPAVDQLIEALRSSNKQIAVWSALTMKYIKDSKTIDPLANNLNFNDDRAQAAATALGHFNDPKAAKALIGALKHKELVSNIQSSIKPIAIEYLLVALQDSNVDVRRSAALILYSIPDSKSVEALIATLNDEDSYVRKYSTDALAQIRDPKSVISFFALLNDRDKSVREAASSALVNANSLSIMQRIYAYEQKNIYPYDEMEWLRSTLIKYHPFDLAAIKQLTLGLNDINPYIRWRSAWCLGERRERQALAVLINLLHDKNNEVRWIAIDSLQKIKDESAASKLLEVCNDSDSGISEKAGKALTTITGANTCH